MAFFGDGYIDDYFEGKGSAGVKVFLSDAVAVSLEAFYKYASEEIFVNNGDWDKDDVGLSLGVRCFF